MLDDTVPNPREASVDLLEWWCHVLLMDCASPEVYSQRCRGFWNALEPLSDTIDDYGRLYNRLQLAMFCEDLIDRPLDSVDEEGGDIPLSKLTAEQWAQCRKDLEDTRSSLLRKDANRNDGKVNKEIDAALQTHPKFTTDYQGVVNVLRICEIVASFQEALEKLQSPKASNQKTSRKVNKAVDNYKQSIQQLDLSDESIKQLTSFLLEDLYKSPKPKDLAQSLQEHLHDIMVNDENECGYAQICSKTRRLLSCWHSHVLAVPKLCQLGYGGFVNGKTSIANDNVSVSSSDDDLQGYATAFDDTTVNADEANVALALSTQQPTPEDIEEEVDEQDKKPRAKRKKTQQEETQTKATQMKPHRPRRLSHPMGDEPHGIPHDSPERKKSTVAAPSSPPRKKPPAPASNVYSEEEILPQDYNDDVSSITEPELSLPRKQAAVARKSPSAKDDSSSINWSHPTEPLRSYNDGVSGVTEPGLSLPRKRAAVARKPSPAKDDGSSGNESDSGPPPPADDGDSDWLPPPPRKRAARGPSPYARGRSANSTVIKWPESDDDDVPAQPKRARSSSKQPKIPKQRRKFTEVETAAIRAGVRRFGVGEWALIRLNSDGVLLSRTNVNIKDKYRNMLKSGQI